MSGTFDMEQWRGTVRKDGVRVERVNGGWTVINPKRRLAAYYCPTCERQLETEHEAKVVANVLFPPLVPDVWGPC